MHAYQNYHHNERRREAEEKAKARYEKRVYLQGLVLQMDTDTQSLTTFGGITLWEHGSNYDRVVKYVNNSQCHENVKVTVENIHRIWRRDDPKGFFNTPNRMLLWHGTKRENIPNILNNGFRLPAYSRQMFGPGIYFADRITKSSNYCDNDRTFLLLCEVGLGKIYSCRTSHSDWTSAPRGYNSVKGNGRFVPDWMDNGHFIKCKIPYGKTAKCTKYTDHALLYNEYIVYDEKQIIVRFLVEVKVERKTCPIQLVTPRNNFKINSVEYRARPVSTSNRSSSVVNAATSTNRMPPVPSTTINPTMSYYQPQTVQATVRPRNQGQEFCTIL